MSNCTKFLSIFLKICNHTQCMGDYCNHIRLLKIDQDCILVLYISLTYLGYTIRNTIKEPRYKIISSQIKAIVDHWLNKLFCFLPQSTTAKSYYEIIINSSLIFLRLKSHTFIGFEHDTWQPDIFLCVSSENQYSVIWQMLRLLISTFSLFNSETAF